MTHAASVWATMAAVIFIAPLQSHAADGVLQSANARVRPSNYYGLITSLEPSVCDPLLQSLNKEYSFSEEQLNKTKDLNLVGDFLLTSDLQIPWRRSENRRVDLSLDYAQVDVADDGKVQALYRWNGVYMGGVGSNELLISTISPSGFDPNDTLSRETLRQIIEHSIAIEPDINTTPAWKRKRDTPSDADYRFYFNVVRLDGRTFLLATPYRRAEQIVLGRPNTWDEMLLDVYALRYRSKAEIPMICHFRHQEN